MLSDHLRVVKGIGQWTWDKLCVNNQFVTLKLLHELPIIPKTTRHLIVTCLCRFVCVCGSWARYLRIISAATAAIIFMLTTSTITANVYYPPSTDNLWQIRRRPLLLLLLHSRKHAFLVLVKVTTCTYNLLCVDPENTLPRWISAL